MYGRNIDFKPGSDYEFYTLSDIRMNAKDFDIEFPNLLVANSDDPWIELDTSIPVSTIVLDVEGISENTVAQIFYYNNETGFQPDQNEIIKLRQGTNFVQLQGREAEAARYFRLDLTDKALTKIKLEDIILCSYTIFPITFWIIVGVMFLTLAAALFCLIYKRDRISELITKNVIKHGEYRVGQVILLALVSISIFLIYFRIFYSGYQYVYYDIGGGDEPQAYFPILVSYISKLANGEFSFWNFNNGLGTSSIGFFFLIQNPFLLLTIIAGVLFGIHTINFMVFIAQVLNILTCSLLCYRYLSNFRATTASRVAASYLLAFNSFIVLYSQHYVHAHFSFYLLLMLILIEEIIKSEHFNRYYVVFALEIFILAAGYFYLCYMICLFAFPYFIIRLLYTSSSKDRTAAIKKLGFVISFGLVGGILSSPLMLPQLSDILFNSTRVASDQGIIQKCIGFLTTPYKAEALKTIFYRLLSSNLQGSGNDFFGSMGDLNSDYYVAPELFYSMFILLFVVVYFITLRKRSNSKKETILNIISGLLIVFIIFNRLGSAAFNGFVMPFGRYTFLIMPVLAYISMIAIDELKDLTKFELAAALGVLVLSFALILMQLGELKENGIDKLSVFVFINLILIILAAVLLIANDRKIISAACFPAAFFVLLFANTVIESNITVNERVLCSFSEDLTDEDDTDTQDSLDYIRQSDSGMYRTEKDFYDLIYYNDAMFQDYYGVSTYNSTLNGNVKEFYRQYCNPAINYYGYDSFWYSFMNVSNDIVQNSLIGVKYIISDNYYYPDGIYNRVYENSTKKVYENPYADGFGHFFTKAINKSEIGDADYIGRLDVISQAVVLEDGVPITAGSHVSYEELENSINKSECIDMDTLYDSMLFNNCTGELNDDIITLSSEIADGEESFYNIDAYLDLTSDINSDSQREHYLEFESDIDYLSYINICFITDNVSELLKPYYFRGGPGDGWQQAKILIPEGTTHIAIKSSEKTINIRNLRVESDDNSILPVNSTLKVIRENDSELSGSITVDESGYLFMPIPYETGWTAEIDGANTELLRADSGFMAVALSEGEHSFSFSYRYPVIETINRLMGI
ncbi:MAG: YfhO family protein [Eubacteriales bacterium]|nr:YfhO family protein [Eubacteriales bacterium]